MYASCRRRLGVDRGAFAAADWQTLSRNPCRAAASVCRRIGIRGDSAPVPSQIEWLCEDLIAIGAITTIYGHSNVGKSTILSDIIAGVTGGRALPGEPADTKREAGNVCLLGGEEDLYATVLPRLVAAGAKVDRVYAFDTLFAESKTKEGERTERPVMLKHDMQRFDAFLDENPQVRMIVFDPLMSFMSGADPNDAVELRAVLTGLKAPAEKHRLSILIVAHTRKSSEGPAIDRLAGSGALQQVSRSVLLVGKHPTTPTQTIGRHGACS
jgi:putative DNA primase/helicase